MAKKKTYAAVMDDMSKKLSKYQERYQQAEQRGDAVGTQDYARRIQRIQAGMETLFQTQEASKQPQMGMGGLLRKFGPGGLTQQGYLDYKYLNSLVNTERTPEETARLKELQAQVDAATKMGWQEDFGFNPDGSIAGRPMGTADVATTATPTAEPTAATNNTPTAGGTTPGPISDPDGDGSELTTHGYRNWAGIVNDFRTSLGLNDVTVPYTPRDRSEIPLSRENFMPEYGGMPTNTGTTDPETQRNAMPEWGGMPAITGTTTAPVEPVVEPETQPAVTATEPATTSTTTSPTADAVAPMAPLGQTVATPELQTRTTPDTTPTGAVDPEGNPITPTGTSSQSGGSALSNFINSVTGQRNSIAQYGQFLPDLYAAYQMEKVQGPTDLPAQALARRNTDINYNDIYAGQRQQLAQTNAMIDRNISNPVVAAAMKRSAANQVQQAFGQQRTQEINQERNLANQYASEIAQNQNINARIAAQNRQRNIDFQNERRATRARMLQQAGQKLGQIYGENQNRELDLKRMGMSALAYEGDMIQRMAERYPELEKLLTGNPEPSSTQSQGTEVKQAETQAQKTISSALNVEQPKSSADVTAGSEEALLAESPTQEQVEVAGTNAVNSAREVGPATEALVSKAVQGAESGGKNPLPLALQYLGVNELDPEGTELRAEIWDHVFGEGHGESKKFTERNYAWCAGFVNEILLQAGAETLETDSVYDKGRAKKYLQLGEGVGLQDAQMGDVIVKAPRAGREHVGFYAGYDPETQQVLILGGNQNNEVNISAYPAHDVLGIRRIQVDALTPEQQEEISAVTVKGAGRTT